MSSTKPIIISCVGMALNFIMASRVDALFNLLIHLTVSVCCAIVIAGFIIAGAIEDKR